MALVHFTTHLKRLAPDPMTAQGRTVGDALGAVFQSQPQLRSYVLDEQGKLRKHICIFADGERLERDKALSHTIGTETELYVMQALSGGAQ